MRQIKIFIPIVLLFAALMPACSSPPGAPPAAASPEKPSRTREQLIELGRQHKTAADLYKALRDEAKGGHRRAPHGQLQCQPGQVDLGDLGREVGAA